MKGKLKFRPHPGVGLRPEHYGFLEKASGLHVTWFEAISENYMGTQGRPREMLRKLRKDFPISLHGVSMNLASHEGVRKDYLFRLRELINEIEPFFVSDHMCWTGLRNHNLHELLPFPYTESSLNVFIENVEFVQDFLDRSICIENVSTYMHFSDNEMSEWEFLNKVVHQTGAGILLDLNNLFVNSQNHHFDPWVFLNELDTAFVKQVHLAGYSKLDHLLFDTHSMPVYPEVWELFSTFVKENPHVPYMIEWDEDIPDFPVLESEVQKATCLWEKHHGQK